MKPYTITVTHKGCGHSWNITASKILPESIDVECPNCHKIAFANFNADNISSVIDLYVKDALDHAEQS